ncbi:hypothetical protein FOCC_FOCC001689, partial [Frankliniella occidentalis]
MIHCFPRWRGGPADTMECTPCPSCRLAVSSSTGRLRWCVAEKGGQRRVRWVLTASVLLLALATVAAVLVLRLARVCVENDASDVEADPGVTSTSANRNRGTHLKKKSSSSNTLKAGEFLVPMTKSSNTEPKAKPGIDTSSVS